MSGAITVPLCEVATLHAGVGFPLEMQGRKTGDYPFVKVGDISRASRSGERILGTADHYINIEDLARLRAKPVPKGSTLFAKIGEAIRQNHRVVAGRPMLIDNNAMAAVPGERIDSQYLFHFLRTVDFYPLASATTVPALRKSTLSGLSLPLPAIAEQRRIVEVLDRAEALRNKRRASLAKVDVLTQAIFREMFGDPVTNSMGWSADRTLGEVAEIVSGITKGRKLSVAAAREVPYLAVSNVQDRALELAVVKTIVATENEIKRYRLELWDLLLTEGGDPDKLGRGTLWRAELPECIHQNHIFRIRITDGDLDPVFLNWLVGSKRGKRYFLKSAKQTTGIASINMKQLRDFPLLLPPLAL